MNSIENPFYNPDKAVESWKSMKMIIEAMEAASPYQRDIEPDGKEKLVAKNPENKRFLEMGELRIERVKDPADPKVEKIIEFTQVFNPEESDTPEIIREAIADPEDPYAYYIIENSEGHILSHIQSSLLEVAPHKEGEKPQGIVFNGFVITDDNYQRRHLAAEIYQSMLRCSLEKAKTKGIEIKAALVEGKASAEPFQNYTELRRIYFEDKAGNFHEVSYIQPPIDWDEKTGFPNGYKEGDNIKKFAAPEHLMIRMIDGQKEMKADELVAMVDIIYSDNYIPSADDEDFAGVYEKIKETVGQFKKEFEDSLKDAKDSRLIFLSKVEREQKIKELEKQGKRLIEFDTTV